MPKRSLPICALVSGGLDSAVLVRRLLAQGRRVAPLYVRCGLRWEPAERYWLRRFLRAIRSPRLAPLMVVDMPLRSVYGSHWSLTGRRMPGALSADAAVYLPGRNVLLISHAAIRCAQRRISTIAVGTLKSNPFGDASPRFFKAFASCLTSALEHPIRIRAPLRRLTKREVVRASRALPLHLTFSCLSPRGYWHCGACNKCAERRRAFRAAGVADLTQYAQ